MMKKLGIVVMAGLFSVSAAGLSFADEKGHGAAPAATAAPANPCAAKGEKAAKKPTKKADEKKAEAPAAAPAPAPAPAKK